MADLCIDAIKALANKANGKMLVIYFDNDQYWYYTDPAESVNNDSFEVVAGVEFIKRKTKIPKKNFTKSVVPSTGKVTYNKTGVNDISIPATIYKPIANIQGMILIDNVEDLPYIDKSTLYGLC